MTIGMKGTYGVQDWAAVAQNAIAKSTELSTHGMRSAIMHIQAGLNTTTAHTGTRFIVQISASLDGNEDWHNWADFVALIGTAVKDLIQTSTLAAGSTAIPLTSHGYTVLGKWLFIEDGTLADSELIFESAQSTNEITILDETSNDHIVGVGIYNVAMEQNITLPFATKRARVVVDNSYDVNGSTLDYKVRVSKASGV